MKTRSLAAILPVLLGLLTSAAATASLDVPAQHAAIARELDAAHADWTGALISRSQVRIKRVLDQIVAPGFTFDPYKPHTTTRKFPDFLGWQKILVAAFYRSTPNAQPVGRPDYTIDRLGVIGTKVIEEGHFVYYDDLMDGHGHKLPTQVKAPNGAVSAVNQRTSTNIPLRIEWVQTPRGWKMQSVRELGASMIL